MVIDDAQPDEQVFVNLMLNGIDAMKEVVVEVSSLCSRKSAMVNC
jgi:phosphoglycerate-specific signal transduction histidine kinase